jgi:hypothetical protein
MQRNGGSNASKKKKLLNSTLAVEKEEANIGSRRGEERTYCRSGCECEANGSLLLLKK